MPQNDNPLFHLEPVAVACLDRIYKDKPVPERFPAVQEQQLTILSIAISLKRIADAMATHGGLAPSQSSPP